jgi:polyene glycosyltransferase
VWRFLGATVVELTLGRQLSRLRRSRGLSPCRLVDRPRGVLVMTNSAFGLEYSRPLPPHLQMVGPMLDDALEAPLPGELQDWLDQGPPVVFVNLGTFARADGSLTQRIAGGLVSDQFRALWVRRDGASRLPAGVLPGSVRVAPWVASQVGVLAHPNVRVFVSHCGINGVHEALHAGTPIVGIPLFADQYDMALRVLDAGAGLMLHKERFSPAELRRSIETVLREERFRRNIPAIQASFRLAGGVKRAADLIEHAAAFGGPPGGQAAPGRAVCRASGR